MSYNDLYTRLKDVNPPISRKTITDAVKSIAEIEKISHVRSGIDVSVLRGFFIRSSQMEHPIVRQTGGNVIVTARGLNRCWERFVYVKELMHGFSSGEECTDSGEKFDILIKELVSAPKNPSAPYTSEIECFWMALGILCPKPQLVKFMAMRDERKIEGYDIALQLRIPEQYVPRIFDERFEKFLNTMPE